MAEADVYKFDLEGILNLKRWCTSFYYVQNENDSGGDAEAIATNLGIKVKLAVWTDELIDLTSAQISVDRYKCQRYGPTKATPDFTTFVAEDGLNVKANSPNATSVVVTKYPFFWDRDFICRNYIVGPPFDDEEYGRLTASALSTWQTGMANAINATVSIVTPEALTFDQVCLSSKRYKDFIDPESPPTPWTGVFSKVKSVQVQTVLGTQRRRRPPRDSAPGAP